MAVSDIRVLSQKDVGEFFGVSQKTISVWKSEGLFAEGGDGTYSLREVGRAIVKRRTAGADNRERIEAAKAERAEFEMEKMRGFVVDRAAVDHLMSEVGQVFRDKLLSMASGLADDLASMSEPADIVRLLTREFTSALEDMARAVREPGGPA